MSLLVGFAPGREDRSGVELAAMLARSSGRSLVIVTVVPAPWPTPVAGHTDREFEAWARELGERAAADASALVAEHCPDIDASARYVAGRSIPATLMAEAEAAGAGMIVVGSGRDGGYGRVNLGSTTDRLLHSAHIPVAVATRGYYTAPGDRVSRATCAFRGDEVSRRTLERTAELCQEIGTVLRIATFAVRGRTMYPPEVGARAEDMVLERWVAQAADLQAQALDELSDAGIRPEQVEAVVATGRSWGSAVDSLPWERDEVLVIGSSTSASLMARLFLGSNASKIVRHSPVPVIVVP